MISDLMSQRRRVTMTVWLMRHYGRLILPLLAGLWLMYLASVLQ